MSSKINLQTCEYARKSSIFQDNQLIYQKHAFHLILSLFYAAFINSQPFFGFLCKKGWCIALIISVIHIGLLLTGVRMPVQENPHFRDFLL